MNFELEDSSQHWRSGSFIQSRISRWNEWTLLIYSKLRKTHQHLSVIENLTLIQRNLADTMCGLWTMKIVIKISNQHISENKVIGEKK